MTPRMHTLIIDRGALAVLQEERRGTAPTWSDFAVKRSDGQYEITVEDDVFRALQDKQQIGETMSDLIRRIHREYRAAIARGEITEDGV